MVVGAIGVAQPEEQVSKSNRGSFEGQEGCPNGKERTEEKWAHIAATMEHMHAQCHWCPTQECQ